VRRRSATIVVAVFLLCTGRAPGAFAGSEPDGASAGEPRLRLSEAAEAALAASPDLAGAAARRAAAAAGQRHARATWMPQLALRESVTRSNNPVFVFGSLLEQGRFTAQHFDPAFLNDPPALTNDRIALDLRYTLFDPTGRGNAGRQADNAATQAEVAETEARQAVRSETIDRYYGVVVADAKVAAVREGVGAAEADEAAIRARVEQGMLVESDLLAAEVQTAALRGDLAAAEADGAVARAALARLLGRPFDAPVMVASEMPERAPQLPPLADAVASGLAARGELAGARLAVDTAELRVRAARGERWPRADAMATYGASRGNDDSAVGLVVALPIFDSALAAHGADAVAALDLARADEAAASDRVTLQVVGGWHRVRAAQARVAAAGQATSRAESVVAIVRERYEQGLTTVTELLRAQTALLDARRDLLSARYEQLVGEAELRRAMGALDDVADFE
jgi:outer membrane protein